MSMVASLYGRMGQDPIARTTKAGNAMTTASIAVDVTGKDAEQQTLWVSVLAFGANADALLQCSKGQMLCAMGRLTRSMYQGRDGGERESWSLMADAILTSTAAKPTGKARPPSQPRPPGQGQQPRPQADARRNEASRQFQDTAPFDGGIQF